MIKRELYMSRIRPFIGTELIKVMTGIRRCGKSVMLELIQQELTESGVSRAQFISINFEDMGYSHLQTAQALHDEITKRAKEIGGKPPEYAHAPLLVAPDGRKLSKREGDLNMEALRQKHTPEQLTGKLAKLAGLRQTDAPVTAIELAADFSWDKVPRADIPIPPDF